MRRASAGAALRRGACACLMIATTALLASGSIGPLHALALAAAIARGGLGGPVRAPRRLWDAAAAAALVLFPVDLIVLSRSLIGAALRLLGFVVFYRCLNLTRRSEIRQALSLSLVQMLAAAASTTEVAFLVFVSAYLLVAIWTLMALASAREHAEVRWRPPAVGRAAGAAGATVALGAVLFFAVPHFGTGYFQPPGLARAGGEALTGFSDRIELGSIGRIKKNNTVVMRVRAGWTADPGVFPLRWRGVALDSFDGRSWSLGRARKSRIHPASRGTFELPDAGPLSAGRLAYDIALMPLMSPVIFTPPRPSELIAEDLTALDLDACGGIHLPYPRPFRLEYRVRAPAPGTETASGPGEDPPDAAPYLALPRFDPRVETLVRRAVEGATSDLQRARALEEFVRRRGRYTLDVNDAGVADPVEHFLLRGNPGHCEYFATALAVLLRHAGIPARVVSGFSGGRWSSLSGAIIVRQSDAHSWVEAWIADQGWTTLDPTPPAETPGDAAGLLGRLRAGLDRAELLWDTWVVGLDLQDQQSLAWGAVEGAAAVARGIGAALDGAATAAALLARRAGRIGGAALAVVVGGCVSAALVVVLGRLLRAGAASRGRHGDLRPLPEDAARALKEFRRYEAGWAARGVRRRSGQTPLEFARELEGRALEPPGAALSRVLSYYGARFGV